MFIFKIFSKIQMLHTVFEMNMEISLNMIIMMYVFFIIMYVFIPPNSRSTPVSWSVCHKNKLGPERESISLQESPR